MTKVIGLDLALNHGAAVELTDGKPTWWKFYTDMAGCAERGKDLATRLAIPGSVKDKQQRQMLRLAQVEHWIDKEVLVPRAPDYVGIEDYALDVNHGSHYMGEVGGVARILVWFRGIPLRLHDPISVKMWATTDGTAQKDAIERAVAERFPGLPWDGYNMPKPPKAKRQNRQTSEDLADAASVAELVWTEVRLREGEITTGDLDHKKRIQVFNRVTKSYPSSLLGRDWLCNPNGNKKPHGGLRARVEQKIKELELAGAPKAAKLLKDLLRDS